MSNRKNEIVEATASTPDDTADDTPAQLGLEPMDSEKRMRWISEAAYHRAAARGFSPGSEVEDWLAAERDIDGTHGSDVSGKGHAAHRGESTGRDDTQSAEGGGRGKDPAGQRKSEADATAQRSAEEHSGIQEG